MSKGYEHEIQKHISNQQNIQATEGRFKGGLKSFNFIYISDVWVSLFFFC